MSDTLAPLVLSLLAITTVSLVVLTWPFWRLVVAVAGGPAILAGILWEKAHASTLSYSWRFLIVAGGLVGVLVVSFLFEQLKRE
jgi:hypothetical protein